MPYERFKLTCQMARQVGAVTEAFFDRDASYPRLLAELPQTFGPYVEGKEYWITIEPAFPHKLKENSCP
jgi:hypothetical protein